MKEQGEIVSWLDNLAPWEIFFTGTVRPNEFFHRDGTEDKSYISVKSLQKGYEHFMRKNYPEISHVYVLEPHAGLATGFHVHAMFDAGHDIWWKDFWGKWKERFGRNETQPIRHKADVQSYVTKYVMKYHDKSSTRQLEEVWWNVKLSKYRQHMKQSGLSGSGTKAAGSKRRVSDPRKAKEKQQQKFSFSTGLAVGVA
jgi:hypothetical protein